MKSMFSVVLLLAGGVLLAAPLTLDHLRNSHVLATVAAGHHLGGIDADTGVHVLSRIVCWATGVLMVMAAVYWHIASSANRRAVSPIPRGSHFPRHW